MTDRYVRSTDGDNADDGTTWALADATLAGAAAGAEAAGDRIFVSQSHAESVTGAQALTFSGTLVSPTLILCANDGAEPPTALATTGTAAITDGATYSWTGHIYVYGIAFSSAGSTGQGHFLCVGSGDAQFFESCDFVLTANASATIQTATLNTAPSECTWKNVRVKFANTGQRIRPHGSFLWDGGSVISGGTTPLSIFSVAAASGRGCRAIISGVDFSNWTAGVHIIDAATLQPQYGAITVRDGKLPASWTGSLFSTTIPQRGFRGRLHNCSAGDVNYALWEEDYGGSAKHETALVRSGGASDGTTQLSWKIATTANVKYPSTPFISPERVIWNDTTGGSKTATVSIIHAETALLKDNEIAIRVQQLGTSGFPLSTFHNDEAADVLATAADQATDTGSDWDDLITARGNLTAYALGDKVKVASNPGRVFQCTTAGTTGVSEAAGFATAADGDSVTDTTATFRTMWRQEVNVSFTPQEKGFIHWTVVVFKASATVFVDPKVIIT